MKPKDPKTPPQELEQEEDLSLSSETERAAMIASVLRDQAEREVVREATAAPGPKPLLPQLTGLALATALAVYVWFGSPAWLEPDPIPLPPVEVERATLRLQMFVQAQAIEHYRTNNGRTPAFLEEAGPPRPGVEYRRLDAQTYLLQGQGDRVRLTYSSRDSLSVFLGEAGEDLLAGVLDQ
jgi:hypothetical protein